MYLGIRLDRGGFERGREDLQRAEPVEGGKRPSMTPSVWHRVRPRKHVAGTIRRVCKQFDPFIQPDSVQTSY